MAQVNKAKTNNMLENSMNCVDQQDVYEVPSTMPNFKTELAAQLSELIPEAIADGKVDVEKLKELLGDDAGDDRERFGLFWPGKKRALRAAQEPTTATLKPDFENSKDWDTTKNVFIEGDNLEVLKILQKHYHGKIKVIYIDVTMQKLIQFKKRSGAAKKGYAKGIWGVHSRKALKCSCSERAIRPVTVAAKIHQRGGHLDGIGILPRVWDKGIGQGFGLPILWVQE